MRVIFCFILFSCSLRPNFESSTRVKAGKSLFNLKDPSGNYLVEREVKRSDSKIITRSTLKRWNGGPQPLEKSVTLYELSKFKNTKQLILPGTSQFSVWFDKKKFFSQIKIDKVKKQLNVLKKSPESKWNGSESIAAPKTKYICFFSSLPECLIEQNLLVKSRNSQVTFYLIWDNYPYYTEQYEGVTGKLLTQVRLSFSKIIGRTLRFELDIGNQIIFYHFDQNLEFEKMYWVAQGISLERRTKQ